jgi:hypothetical protein
MGGQPWPELELHGRQPWGARRRGERGGRRKGGRAAWGATRGRGGVPWGLWAARSCVAVLLVVSAVREKKKRRKEKGEEKEKEGKKEKIWKFFEK